MSSTVHGPGLDRGDAQEPLAFARDAEGFAVSASSSKSPLRDDDGYVSSGQYVRSWLAGNGTSPALELFPTHPVERWLASRASRWLLRRLAKPSRSGVAPIETILATSGNGDATRWQRLRWWPYYRYIRRLRRPLNETRYRELFSRNRAAARGAALVARSIAEFGLVAPLRFSAPALVVWNLTNRCNLRCRHCYQSSDQHAWADELTLAEKLALVDHLAAEHTPLLAISGGEPTICPDLLAVVQRAHQRGIHVTLATNGTTLTRRTVEELADAGVGFLEVSLDSTHPERHDRFRGVPGMWRRAVAGLEAAVACRKLRVGLSMCVYRGNVDEFDEMLALADKLGANWFGYFNFIPVGRGRSMIHEDITPRQREQVLAALNARVQANRGVISTAPQLGRICLAGAMLADGLVACGHIGAIRGHASRLLAKYVGGCGAGRLYACVEPNGDVTPCVYMPTRVIGNVRQKPLAQIFRQSPYFELLADRSRRLHHCEVCAIKTYCGGCRARADAYFGEINAGDPGCLFNEKHWEALLASSEGDSATPADRTSR